MRHWFQNLNENKKRQFHFRGSLRRESDCSPVFTYEVCSGPALKLKYSSSSGDGPMLILGLFFVTLYLTSRYFKLPILTYGLDYGFYFSDWTFRWSWGTEPMSWSSRTPKWRQFSFSLDDFLLGRPERLEREVLSAENIKFKIGDKEFLMNSIKWDLNRSFRRHIPFTLYHHDWCSVLMKIDNPPMRAGKGENSWDCDDDGSFGLSMGWNHEAPNWHNRDKMIQLAIEEYVNIALKDAKRYGSGSGERGIKHSDQFVYIGVE